MTNEQKRNLDKKILEFDSFMELHEYANKNNIIFDNEEWEEYSERLLTRLVDSDNSSIIEVNLDNLILT